jgi:Ribose/xylose/arabinose/galactoside ABC-type transport systems, permease components
MQKGINAERQGKFDLSSLTTLFVLAGLCIVLAIISKGIFITKGNLLNIAAQVTVNAIVSVGMTIVLFTGGIDLSVGSVLGFSGMLLALLLKAGIPVPLAIVACLVIGCLCGLINGLLITAGKLPPFIATLGIMNVARAGALLISGGRSISAFPASFRFIGAERIPGTGIPVQVIFMLILYVAAYYLLRYRKTGRFIYSIGGNKEATRLSGINVRRYECVAYVISGLTAAIAAVVLVSKLNAVQATAGMGYEMDAVAAAVIGGTSLSGGVGSIWGTILGAVMIGVIRNGLNLMNANSYLQQGIIGVVIIIAVLIDMAKKRK